LLPRWHSVADAPVFANVCYWEILTGRVLDRFWPRPCENVVLREIAPAYRSRILKR